MPAGCGRVGTGRAACQAYTERPLRRWQLSAQSSPLLSVALSAPSNNALPSTGLGKLRCTIGKPHSRVKVGGNPAQLEQGGTLAHWFKNWALGLLAVLSFPLSCTCSTPFIVGGRC